MIVLMAGFYVLLPLFRQREDNQDIGLSSETESERLQYRKNIIYRNITDLHFEYSMGRLSNADFQQLETGYKNEAAAVLQKLDQLNTLEHHPEAAIDQENQKDNWQSAGVSHTQDSLKCTSCGTQAIPGKKFCADCGQRLTKK
jgi:hypothetical protein